MRETLSPSRLLVVGFSLGGNIVGKWFGEDREDCIADAGAMISAPFGLGACARALDRTLGGFYGRQFLKTLIPKALEKERQFPGIFNTAALRRCRSIVEHDDLATAPLHGFAGAWDYYARCSSADSLPGVRRPLLVISSLDDPLVPRDSVPRELLRNHEWILPGLTRQGGHLGFHGGDGKWWLGGVLRGWVAAHCPGH